MCLPFVDGVESELFATEKLVKSTLLLIRVAFSLEYAQDFGAVTSAKNRED